MNKTLTALALLAALALTGCEDAPGDYCEAHPNNQSACPAGDETGGS